MKLIVGLGNPGNEYENNRHNIGFIYLDKYLKSNNILNFKEKYKSLYTKENIKNETVFFQKPQTYMNLSGEAIYELISFYKINPKKDLIVIYDDMDLKIGEIKIKNKGKSAGHNGIKSIISHIGDEFIRLRIGIGKPNNKSVISHVLGNFTEEEKNILNNLDKHIFKIINSFINDNNIERLMSKYNIKKKENSKNNFKLRKAKLEDMEKILEIKELAIEYQKEIGLTQWSNNYPLEKDFKNDIELKRGYIYEKDNQIYAYASLNYDIDNMYLKTYDGNINNNIDYSSIHRVMVNKNEMNKGIGKEFLEKLIRISTKDSRFVVRIDTHKDNIAMIKLIDKLNFKYIAKVHANDGTERNVFEYTLGGN
ncbi:aminoacyl-tRNA hydrolase [Streptobacillus notomytis]|uniref:aminoacyl-tRNA hydrolase n=1 Tax=Streptobacillus notomytis TaxID=1712031 RepID=UPI00093700D7|nr:aminoacyl-tRNA hydrolase [Streptobacillus notomytis]